MALDIGTRTNIIVGDFMEKLISLDQLNIGTKLRIVASSERDCYGSVSVKKIIEMKRWDGEAWSEPYDHEILLNRKKNYYFSMNNYLSGKSNWVKEVYVLEGVDKRLKARQ
jgi:hypothetical protein